MLAPRRVSLSAVINQLLGLCSWDLEDTVRRCPTPRSNCARRYLRSLGVFVGFRMVLDWGL